MAGSAIIKSSRVPETLRGRIHQRLKEIEPEIRALSLDLHEHPETGLNEVYASARISAYLESKGFCVQRGLAGLSTSFKAVSRVNGTPETRVVFPAEYDALPELGHACGHNLIAASSVAAALGLEAVADSAGIEVNLVGTPDEEGTGGKIPLLESGVFEGMDVALMAHPSDATQTRRIHRAAWEMRVIFHGKASHAVISPEEGINALDACVAFYASLRMSLPALDAACREESPDGIACPCIIEEGGLRPNIVPDRAVAHLSLRAPSEHWLLRGRAMLEIWAEEAASGIGAKWDIETVGNIYQAMRVDEDLASIFEDELERQGVPCDSTVQWGCGSTDIGNISQIMPTIHPTIAITQGAPMAAHTPEFAQTCAGEEAHRAMLAAAETMAVTALEWVLRRKEDKGS